MSEQMGPPPDPYPEPEQPKPGMYRPEVAITQPERQRRWTVLLRLLLLIPHFVVLAVLGVVAFFVVVIGWFAALVMGRLPRWVADFLALYIGYQVQVNASSMLLVDTYPPFLSDEPSYPVQVDLRPAHLNRWTVLFRIVLSIPAGIVSTVVGYGWGAVSFIIWLIVLITGRTPRPLFDATTAILRFQLRLNAYTYLLTGTYPRRLFGDAPAVDHPGPRANSTRPLVLGRGGRALLIVFIVLGVLVFVGQQTQSTMSAYEEVQEQSGQVSAMSN